MHRSWPPWRWYHQANRNAGFSDERPAAMKSTLEELAVFGGPVAFERPLHVGAPNIGSRRHLFQRLNIMLDARWLTNDGPYVQQFEQAIRQQIGIKHCIGTCNATVALEILVRAAGLSGEVIVPAFTFVATAHALRWVGLTPVFADIHPSSHTLDPAAVEAAITPRTSGIMAVHLWGRPCDVDGLEAVAARHDLVLEVLSFHATKIVNSFEGGAIVTNDDELAERVRRMRCFGFSDYDTVTALGINGKMTEAAAAMGLTSLESLSTFVDANKSRHELYGRLLSGTPGLTLLPYDERERCNYQYVVVEIDEPSVGLSRDELQRVLFAENILARRYFYPGCHRVEPYASEPPTGGWRLPVTDRIAGRVLCLPTGTAASLAAIRQICGLIRLTLARAHDVRRRLQAREVAL